ncbi:MAG: S9 family peptidase [Pseudomonadota bacterium]
MSRKPFKPLEFRIPISPLHLLISIASALVLVACGADPDTPSPKDKVSMPSTTNPFAEIAPPIVEKRPVEIVQHGERRVDNYGWLRAENWQQVLDDPSTLPEDIRAVLDAENAYYGEMTSDLESLREALFSEMRARIKENDESAPMRDGAYLYWIGYRDGGEYPIFKRRLVSGGDDEILYDGDKERGASKFFSIGSVTQSPDHIFIAYSVDRLGAEDFTIKVRDIATGEDLPDTIDGAYGGDVAWISDASGFYYIERDESSRPRRVKQHLLGQAPGDDRVVYEEPDDAFFLSLSKTLSGTYVVITSSSQITSEVRVVDAADNGAEAQIIEPRRNGVEYYVNHRGDNFYIMTNEDGAVDFKLVETPVTTPARENWVDIRPHRPGVTIVDVVTFKDYLVLLERSDALPRIRVAGYDGAEHDIEFDEQAYSLGVDEGFEYDTATLRLTYESPSTPRETFDYDMGTRERSLVKRQEVPIGHNSDDYTVERFFTRSEDGAEVPVTVLRKASTPVDGTASVILYGYGSYGITIPASFSTSVLPLVDRGLIYVIAHPRGGAAKGRQWYLDGKLSKKMNTFVDFNAVAEDLVRKGYARENGIVIHGGSAGGLLVGASVNLKPELYAGVIAEVPFVDVINTISDAELPLTPPEWEEWGNPIDSKEEYGWIRSYSPYDNVKNETYPPILATGGLTDYRVTYWEMPKWIAKLRDEASGGPFVLRMNMGAGHAGSAARFERLDERAHVYAFALKALGETASSGE